MHAVTLKKLITSIHELLNQLIAIVNHEEIFVSFRFYGSLLTFRDFPLLYLLEPEGLEPILFAVLSFKQTYKIMHFLEYKHCNQNEHGCKMESLEFLVSLSVFCFPY